MTDKELEELKNFKLYTFEGDVYVKAEDYKKKAIENKKLKAEGQLEENPTSTVMTTTQIITYGVFLPLPTIVFCMVDYDNM